MRKIAVIAGDGIGVEVTAAALDVLRAALARHNQRFDIEELDYGAERYLRDGTTMPAGEIERFRRDVDAVFLGAVGDPRAMVRRRRALGARGCGVAPPEARG